MAALMEEPKALPPHCVYRGGSYAGVHCANCDATSTSGSWRRGWELEDHTNANLCNRCGQRWVKLGRALGRAGGGYGAAIAGPQAFGGPHSSGAAHAGLKRSLSVFDPSATYSQMLSTGMRPRLRSDTASEDSMADGAEVPAPARVAPKQAASGPAYCVQKMTDCMSSYALFWAGDGFSAPVLAAIGVDSRSTGHFTYSHAPGLPATVPPLCCTNRGDVVAWLATSLGVRHAVTEEAIQPPTLSIQGLQDVLEAALYRPTTVRRPAPESLDEAPFTENRTSASRFDRGAKIKPPAAPFYPHQQRAPLSEPAQNFLPHFRCSACGNDDHASSSCPLNCTSPPALIANPLGADPFDTQLDLLFLEMGVGEEGESPTFDTQDTVFECFMEFSPGSGGAVSNSKIGLKDAAQCSAPAAPAQQQQQEQQAQLLQWVRSLPSQGLENTIAAWAAALACPICEAPPCTQQGSGRWVTTGEALAILHQLSLLEVSMEQLERTEVSRAVAMLQSHSNLAVASSAQSLVEKWRSCAAAALGSVASQRGCC